jgi:hypothetical protein
MPKTQADKFANQAVITAVESAVNTLTFKKLETGVSLFEKVAWLISRLEYYVSTSMMALLVASADGLQAALTATDQMAALTLTNNAVLDYFELSRHDIGAAATGHLVQNVFTKDFSTLPGGGILVPPNPLYLGSHGVSVAAVVTMVVKIFYTTYELGTEEYWELVEARRIISS